VVVSFGEQHVVDELDGGVGGLEVAADHPGVAVDRVQTPQLRRTAVLVFTRQR
jgi:hypothetical protein